MSKFCGLPLLVRSLASNKADRRIILSTLLILIRSRKYFLIFLYPFLLFAPSFSPKLILWRTITRSLLNANFISFNSKLIGSLNSSIVHTHAYDTAYKAICSSRTGHRYRIFSYSRTLDTLRKSNLSRILLFHHHDNHGYLPVTWFDFLRLAQGADWQVIVTSSYLHPDVSARLAAIGILVVNRSNIGLCLGAYRDISVLFGSNQLFDRVSSFVLMNDSCLLLKHPLSLLDHINTMHSDFHNDSPTLAGLTDSFERGEYHLQSFFLYANQSLLEHPAWYRFWLNLSIDTSKDVLIASGEIGLSQFLLAYGVNLRPFYPLVNSLVVHSSVASELDNNQVFNLDSINQTLFTWRSLLERGFPLLKKSLLLNNQHSSSSVSVFSQISNYVPSEILETLIVDIHILMVNKFSSRPRI